MSLSVCILNPRIHRGWGFIFQSPREWSLHGANFYRAIQAAIASSPFNLFSPAFVTGEDFCFFTLWEKTPSSHFLCARLLRKLTLSSLWVFLIALSPRPQMETWLRLARFVSFSTRFLFRSTSTLQIAIFDRAIAWVRLCGCERRNKHISSSQFWNEVRAYDHLSNYCPYSLFTLSGQTLFSQHRWQTFDPW